MMKERLILLVALAFTAFAAHAQKEKFNEGWLFRVDTTNNWNEKDIWTKKQVAVTLPHDWSIEQPFDKYSPSGNRGAALRGGLGIYEKKFTLDNNDKGKNIFIVFPKAILVLFSNQPQSNKCQ